MQMQLLSRAVEAWTRVCADAAAERQQLAEAAAPALHALAESKLRRVIAAWRQTVQEQHQEREAVSYVISAEESGCLCRLDQLSRLASAAPVLLPYAALQSARTCYSLA
jgi:hypothetical protein